MLVRDHDLAHADRLAVLILHGDLALGVRTQHLLLAGVARFRDQPQDLVGVEDRRRHQVRRFVGGVTEHDALVAGALFLVGAGLQRVDALRDVGRLRMQQDLDVGGLPVEAFLLVADVLDRGAHDAFDLVVGDGFGPRVSPAITTLLVVASVSQAARIAQGSMPALGPSRKNRSTISSEIRSQTLSG